MTSLEPGSRLDPGEASARGESRDEPILVGPVVLECPHAVVFAGQQGATGVQLTVYDESLTNDSRARSLLLSGVGRAARFAHPNLLTTWGVTEHERLLVTVRADPEAATARNIIHEAISAGRPVDLVRALSIGEQICAALQALHGAARGHESVHGYITADTVYVDRTDTVLVGAAGEGLVVPLSAGFGRYYNGGLLPIAPELLGPHPVHLPAADVYAIAALLLELLAGVVVERPGMPLASVPLPGPPVLRDLLQHCIEPDPRVRVAEPAGLGTALRQIRETGGLDMSVLFQLAGQGPRAIQTGAFAVVGQGHAVQPPTGPSQGSVVHEISAAMLVPEPPPLPPPPPKPAARPAAPPPPRPPRSRPAADAGGGPGRAVETRSATAAGDPAMDALDRATRALLGAGPDAGESAVRARSPELGLDMNRLEEVVRRLETIDGASLSGIGALTGMDEPEPSQSGSLFGNLGARASAPVDDRWLLVRPTHQEGPFSIPELVNLARSGRLALSDRLQQADDGTLAWVRDLPVVAAAIATGGDKPLELAVSRAAAMREGPGGPPPAYSPLAAAYDEEPRSGRVIGTLIAIALLLGIAGAAWYFLFGPGRALMGGS